MLIRPWQNLPTGGHGHVICMGNLGGCLSQENKPKSHPQKLFFPYKQISGRNVDNEWLRMTNAFILCDLVWKVKKSHAANREAIFKLNRVEGTFTVISLIPYTRMHLGSSSVKTSSMWHSRSYLYAS